jgi:hypothetical protein
LSVESNAVEAHAGGDGIDAHDEKALRGVEGQERIIHAGGRFEPTAQPRERVVEKGEGSKQAQQGKTRALRGECENERTDHENVQRN